MKKFIKLLSMFTLILICSFNFIACSNNESEQTTQISTNNISDTGTNQEENSADNVTDEDSDLPIKLGIYKFDKEVLNFKDTYYKDEQELFDFFKTNDLNGVYTSAVKNGFNEFAKSITTFTIADTDVKFAISFNKNESDGSQLGLLKLYEIPKNKFIIENKQIVYDVVDNKIISQEHLPEINVDPETKKVSLTYQFSYTDSETSETIYTPLYIKADLTLYYDIDLYQTPKNYTYVENSAKLITTDNSLDKDGNVTRYLRDTVARLSNPFVPRRKWRDVSKVENLSIK